MGTRRERATEDLHVQLAALKSVPAACVIAFDRQLRTLLATGDALGDLGLPPDGAEGQALAELVGGERWTFWEPLLQMGLQGMSTSVDVDVPGRAAGLYRVRIGPWCDLEGAIVGGLAVATDISDRNRAAETLASELEAFNYSVSHDLRAPLRAIDGFSAAVARRNGAQLDESGRDMLARIRRAVANMGTLIDALLELSRLSRRDMDRDLVDLSALALGVADDLRAREPERTVAFVIEDGLSAVGDRELLRIALENLFENAWKFTAGRDDAQIEFARTHVDGRTVFAVRDNGVGFDMAGADRLFAPFQRLHSDEEFPGLGIGLATVQRIVRRHSGTIRGEGRVGEGATFAFELGDAIGSER